MRPLALILLLLIPASASADVSSPSPAVAAPAPAVPLALPAPPDVAAAPARARKTKTGLITLVLRRGTGTVRPIAADTAVVHYTGWTTDGKMFDSSVPRGQLASFPLTAVIPGFAEGVELMVVGEKRRLWIPESLAYKGAPARPAGILVFDVELHDIKKR